MPVRLELSFARESLLSNLGYAPARHQKVSVKLVPEMPHPGEDHGKAGLIGRIDNLIVPDRSPGLDHGRRTGLDCRHQRTR